MCCSRLASRRKSPSGHHPTTLSGYIFATKACIDNRKKIVKQQYLLYMSSQYGELRPTSGWDHFVSLGHPCKFQLVSRLGSITARHLVVDVSQTLRRWTEGATYIRQGHHHVGHWPTFLVPDVRKVYHFQSRFLCSELLRVWHVHGRSGLVAFINCCSWRNCLNISHRLAATCGLCVTAPSSLVFSLKMQKNDEETDVRRLLDNIAITAASVAAMTTIWPA